LAEAVAVLRDVEERHQAQLAALHAEALAKAEAAALWQGRAEVLMTELRRERERVRLLEAGHAPPIEAAATATAAAAQRPPWWAWLAFWRHPWS
jgi:hypothetical protein